MLRSCDALQPTRIQHGSDPRNNSGRCDRFFLCASVRGLILPRYLHRNGEVVVTYDPRVFPVSYLEFKVTFVAVF
jgi:hypothetical protein